MEQLYTVEQVAEWAHTTASGIWTLRSRNKGPKGVRVGRRVLFRESDIRRWLEERAEPERAAL